MPFIWTFVAKNFLKFVQSIFFPFGLDGSDGYLVFWLFNFLCTSLNLSAWEMFLMARYNVLLLVKKRC